jgi:hypothetical protein
MLAKTVFAATFFALAQFAVASPPGCLLGAINQYSDPADLKSVCKAKDVTSKIASFCGDNTKDALSAFADVCNGQGIKVSTDVPTSTGSVKPSGTGASASASGTGSSNDSSSNSTLATATGAAPKPSGSAAGSATGTSTGALAESTGAAGKLEIGLAAAIAGLMAIAL